MKDYGINITIHDPWADENEVMQEYGLESSMSIPNEKFDAVVLTVSHNKFKKLDLLSLKNKKGIIYDVKNFIKDEIIDGRL